ncbi:MAG TPA: TonB family protein [Thermoanaerobaculaceae bacterium]|nr:TonB family protein [Thermoanaerobaculaceae bacterium]
MSVAARVRIRRILPSLVAAVAVTGMLGLAGFWIAGVREDRPRRTTMRYRVTNIRPEKPARPEPKPDPAPRGSAEPRPRDVPTSTRVELKAPDLIVPAAPPPPSEGTPVGRGPAGGGGGRLGLADVSEGPGDVFELVGKPAGRSLLGKGRLGDGTGPEDDDASEGEGPGDARAREAAALQRYGWYYRRLAGELEEAFRGIKELRSTSVTVELRVWVDGRGRVSRVKLARSTGNAALDEAIQSIQGLSLRQPPPSDIPMPMIARLVVRRPE